MNMQALMQQAQKMQREMEKAQKDLEAKEFEIISAGGGIKVIITGKKLIKNIEIDEDSQELGVYVTGKHQVNAFDMYACCWPGCLSVIYNVDKIGLIQIQDVRKNNDTALWLRVIEKTNCYLFPKMLGQYRRRRGSITPPSIKNRILWHYRLFRDAEHLGKVMSIILMLMNIVGNSYKKLFYVKKYSK